MPKFANTDEAIRYRRYLVAKKEHKIHEETKELMVLRENLNHCLRKKQEEQNDRD